jgi:choline dehydrogenase
MLDALREARRIAAQAPFARIACGAPLVPSSDVGDEDEEGLLAAVHSTLGTFHHPVGTCSMGDDPAEGAVVDGRGQVHGIKGLFVADASVMPYIPSAPVHLPTIMLAERVAGWLAAS